MGSLLFRETAWTLQYYFHPLWWWIGPQKHIQTTKSQTKKNDQDTPLGTCFWIKCDGLYVEDCVVILQQARLMPKNRNLLKQISLWSPVPIPERTPECSLVHLSARQHCLPKGSWSTAIFLALSKISQPSSGMVLRSAKIINGRQRLPKRQTELAVLRWKEQDLPNTSIWNHSNILVLSSHLLAQIVSRNWWFGKSIPNCQKHRSNFSSNRLQSLICLIPSSAH